SRRISTYPTNARARDTSHPRSAPPSTSGSTPTPHAALPNTTVSCFLVLRISSSLALRLSASPNPFASQKPLLLHFVILLPPHLPAQIFDTLLSPPTS